MAADRAASVSLTTDDGRVVASRVRIASSFLGRLRGLMGVPALDDGEGLFLTGTNSIHMLFMRCPIDCVFVGDADAEGRRPVIGIRHSLRPWWGVVWWVRGARGVAELRAGSLISSGLKVGDKVQLQERHE